MTTYKIEFTRAALKEWNKLDATIRAQLDRKLREVAKSPHIPSAKMRGFHNTYRIKARSAGFRLIYFVENEIVTIFVVAIGKRERGEVFEIGLRRLKEMFGDD